MKSYSNAELLDQMVDAIVKNNGVAPTVRIVEEYHLTQASVSTLMRHLGGAPVGTWKKVQKLAMKEYHRRYPEALEPSPEMEARKERALEILCKTVMEDEGRIQPYRVYHDEYELDGLLLEEICQVVGGGSWTETKLLVRKRIAMKNPDLRLTDLAVTRKGKLATSDVLRNLILVAYKVGRIPSKSDAQRDQDILELAPETILRRLTGQMSKWSLVKEIVREKIQEEDPKSPILVGKTTLGWNSHSSAKKALP